MLTANGYWGRENHSPLGTWLLVGCSIPVDSPTVVYIRVALTGLGWVINKKIRSGGHELGREMEWGFLVELEGGHMNAIFKKIKKIQIKTLKVGHKKNLRI